MKTKNELLGNKDKDLSAGVDNTIDELDALAKSEDESGADEIDDLQKALDDFDTAGDDDLSKAEGEGAGEGEGEGEGEGAGEGEGEGAEDLDKSLDLNEDDLENELIKASDAYDDLRKSVEDYQEGTNASLDDISNALASQTSLSISIGKGLVRLSKSIAEIGKRPGHKSPAQLLDESEGENGGEALTKSNREVESILKKAVMEEKIPSNQLSVWGTYKDVTKLTDEAQALVLA